MAEIIVVVLIVAVVLVLAGRSFYRTMTGKKESCGCGSPCGSCSGSSGKTCEGDIGRKHLPNNARPERASS